MLALVEGARGCRACVGVLGHEPRPVFRVHEEARVLIVGQAPGAKVHASGVPWADASGRRLREWLGVDEETFYDASRFAILPMGFCYPGKGKSGDLPPRPECAPQWMQPFVDAMPRVELTLLVGRYAQQWFLGETGKRTLTETVQAWREYAKRKYIVLPHPSPRNGIWLRKNPFFEQAVVPTLRRRVKRALRR